MTLNIEYRDALRRVEARQGITPPPSPERQRLIDREAAEALEAAEEEARQKRADELRRREEMATGPLAEELAALRRERAGAYGRF